MSHSSFEFHPLMGSAEVQSPCVRNCCLNDDDICMGCFRTLEDIKNWGAASSPERLAVLRDAQIRRTAAEKKDLV